MKLKEQEQDEELLLIVGRLKGEPPRRNKKNLTRFYMDHVNEIDKYDEFYGN